MSFLQLEKRSRSIASAATFFTSFTTATCRRSIFLSALDGVVTWMGHSSSGRRRNSGPFTHLLFNSLTVIPLDRSSATLTSLGICFHWLGSELLCISPILDDTNGLKAREGLCIHAKTMVLSMKNVTIPNSILDSSWMDLANRLATTAACNSNRVMVSCFKGATLDFAAINFTVYVPSFLFCLR